MVLLGFQMTLHGDRSPIRVGKGIEPNGFITDQKVFAMWGVRNYTSDVWGSTKKAVGEAKKLLSSPEGKSKVSQAILKLKEVEDYRKKDMARHGGVCEAHAHQLKQIEATRKALEALKSPFNLGALAHALSTAAAATRSAPEPDFPQGRERPEDVSEGAGSADTATSEYEIVAYLKRRSLDRIAERVCEELGLEEIDDLRYVKTEGLSKVEWLKDVQKEKLLKLCREVTARLMTL
jgi:hypothetical protein